MKVIIVLLILNYNFIYCQKSNEEFLFDLLTNEKLDLIKGSGLESFSINFKVVTDNIPKSFIMYAPYKWYGEETFNKNFYDSLKNIPITSNKIQKRRKIYSLIRNLDVPLKKGSKNVLTMSSPLYYHNKYYVHFKIVYDNEMSGHSVFIWLLTYDDEWKLINIEKGRTLS